MYGLGPSRYYRDMNDYPHTGCDHEAGYCFIGMMDDDETLKDPSTLKRGDQITGKFLGRTETWTYLYTTKGGMFWVERGGERMGANPMTFGYALPV